MMIKQRKHNINIDKLDNASIKNADESPSCANKFRTGDIRPEDKSGLLAQSTPKRSDASFSKSQDGSDSPDYRMSFPLTQDENIEVTWDWHSSVRKDGGESGKKTNEITTPKRAALKRRKRPPSSPLAYKPIRKQLIKQENTDGIDQFKAQMIALAKQVQSGHDNANIKKSNNKLDGIIDISDKIESDINYQEAKTLVIVDSPETLGEVDQLVDENVDDLFNDSMDEVIIRFSQETEKKLNISPTNNTKENNGISTSNVNKQNSDKSLNYLSKLTKNDCSNGVTMKESNYNNSTSSKIQNQLQKPASNVSKITNKYQGSNTTNLKLPETVKKQTVVLDNDDLDLFIPDDSFDDFVVSCDVPKNETRLSMTKSTNIQMYNTNYQKSYMSNVTKTSKDNLPKVINTSSSSSTSTSLRTSNSVQKNNVGSINNTLVKNTTDKTLNVQQDTTPTRTWKFFKSKSRSESNFSGNENQTGTNLKQDNSGAGNNSRANSSSCLKSKSISNVGSKNNSRIYGGKGVSNNGEPVQRAWTTSCLDSNVTKLAGIQKDNINMYNVNRSRAEKGNGDSRSGNEIQRHSSCITTGLQSMQLQCTPEEIERKRMEAKKKLEARKKRIQANTIVHSGSASNSRQQIPVER